MLNVSVNFNVANLYKLNNYANKNIAFKGCKKDTFQKSKTEKFDEKKLTEMLSNPSFIVDRKFMEKLSSEEYNFCLNFAKAPEEIFSSLPVENQAAVLEEDVRDIAKYSEGFYKGLERIAKNNKMDVKDIMVVGIGQSPSSVIKAMDFKGLKTGYCPISALRLFRLPAEYVNEETIEKGFSHWRNHGFDLESLFKEKLIVFVDHKESGATIEGFKHIIYKIQNIMQNQNCKNKKSSKVLFMSMKDVNRGAKQSVFDSICAREAEDTLFHTSYFKTLYSPLFKLPLDKITSIDEFSKYNTDANKRFNKFSILLYEEMKNPTQPQGFKSKGRLDAQRQDRLSCVVSDSFK